MGAMPMVIVFAVIFSLLSYNFLQEGVMEKKRSLFFHSLQKEIVGTHNKKQSAKHNSRVKPSTAPSSKEDKVFQREGKITAICLNYLLQHPTNDLLQFLEKVLLRAYEPILEDKKDLELLIQGWLKSGAVHKKCLDLWPKEKRLEKLFYQMLKGGFGHEPKDGMCMASLGDLFHFSSMKGAFVYSKASNELLEIYFGKAIAVKIIEKETLKKGLLSSAELREIIIQQMDSERAKKCLEQIVFVG